MVSTLVLALLVLVPTCVAVIALYRGIVRFVDHIVAANVRYCARLLSRPGFADAAGALSSSAVGAWTVRKMSQVLPSIVPAWYVPWLARLAGAVGDWKPGGSAREHARRIPLRLKAGPQRAEIRSAVTDLPVWCDALGKQVGGNCAVADRRTVVSVDKRFHSFRVLLGRRPGVRARRHAAAHRALPGGSG